MDDKTKALLKKADKVLSLLKESTASMDEANEVLHLLRVVMFSEPDWKTLNEAAPRQAKSGLCESPSTLSESREGY